MVRASPRLISRWELFHDTHNYVPAENRCLFYLLILVAFFSEKQLLLDEALTGLLLSTVLLSYVSLSLNMSRFCRVFTAATMKTEQIAVTRLNAVVAFSEWTVKKIFWIAVLQIQARQKSNAFWQLSCVAFKTFHDPQFYRHFDTNLISYHSLPRPERSLWRRHSLFRIYAVR